MKSIASLNVDSAAGLLARLRQGDIPFELRPVTETSGLEFADIMVADDDYELACDVAEAWEAELCVAAERRSLRHCPACGSSHVEDTGTVSFGVTVWQCKDCGNGFAKQ